MTSPQKSWDVPSTSFYHSFRPDSKGWREQTNGVGHSCTGKERIDGVHLGDDLPHCLSFVNQISVIGHLFPLIGFSICLFLCLLNVLCSNFKCFYMCIFLKHQHHGINPLLVILILHTVTKMLFQTYCRFRFMSVKQDF